MLIENRFLKYVEFDTQSDDQSTTSPSTSKQMKLLEFLKDEMMILGVEDIELDQKGILYGRVKNNGGLSESLGFIAHVDTALECSGKDIHPNIIRDYDGEDLYINDDLILSTEEYPYLKQLKHHDLITTDGTTLLGGDDKAGIAIIMSTIEYLHKHPEIIHSDIYIAFTSDEEIGRGVDHFDFNKFKADFAYTIDGGSINEFNFENFNAYKAIVDIKGSSIHPGDAKNKLINANQIATIFNLMLNQNELPEYTCDYEGFHHLTNMSGEVEKARLEYIIRNHDYTLLKKQIDDFNRVASFLNSKYGKEMITIQYHEQYSNMKDIILEYPNVINIVKEAMKLSKINIDIVPIRGGTDGAILTYKGLPTPNLGTGDYNPHSKSEFVDINQMKKGIILLLNIIKINEEY